MTEQSSSDHAAPDHVAMPDNVALLAFIQAGGVWGLAPSWVPRVYTDVTQVDLQTVEAKLKDKL